LILFIALPDPQDKSAFELHAFPLALLPRRCPRCGCDTIIGHGQRRKQAHDEHHDWISVSAARVAKPSPSFLLGRRRTDAKIPIDYQIQRRCGVGPVADC
jgi:hypothetical protein